MTGVVSLLLLFNLRSLVQSSELTTSGRTPDQTSTTTRAAAWTVAQMDLMDLSKIRPDGPSSFTMQTIRQIDCLSVGMRNIRSKFSNTVDTEPLQSIRTL